ncbi:MAG: adenylate/guanylate cyclase domain-containing protein [Alphaproteobacteria bacterium]|nr:adenylate/guanylate cyclase domain-containing protein [Alphaproteobacteria bacterium]
MPVIRRLVAILAADVAGYARLVGADEEDTFKRLRAYRRELIDVRIAEYRGRIVQETGDGLLVEFPSIVEAVRCAIEVQQQMATRNDRFPAERRIEFRMGINLGDVIEEGSDIFGDGVNIAARLEALAEPGGLYLSAAAYDQVRDRIDFPFEDMGAQQVKNIARPVRAYRALLGTGRSAVAQGSSPLSDKPSIAVLAFTNMSDDPEQEFFADGIAEDIITVLSKSRSLLVIARNSSFVYKGKATALSDIRRDLGVRYVLEGSVRKSGNRVRVTAQLIDATTGGHLWAERYDRDLADIFAVQDEITASVSAAIQPALESSERRRAARKPPHSLDAWESYHRGMWHFAKVEAAEYEKARSFLQRSLELDPQFAAAAAALALTYLNEITLFRADLRAVNVPLAMQHAIRAVAIDPTDATGHAALARALWISGRHAESLVQADIAIDLDPSSAVAQGAQGGARLWGGFPREAIEPLRRAMRLSPFDPMTPLWLHFIARAHYYAGEYDGSIAVARQLGRSLPNFRQPYNTLIAALGQVGRVEEARAVMHEGLERFGERFRYFMSLPLDEIRELRPEDREHMIEGFRKAGLV